MKSAWRKTHWGKWTFWRKVRHVLAVIGSLLSVAVMFLFAVYSILMMFGLWGFILHVRDAILLGIMHGLFG